MQSMLQTFSLLRCHIGLCNQQSRHSTHHVLMQSVTDAFSYPDIQLVTESHHFMYSVIQTFSSSCSYAICDRCIQLSRHSARHRVTSFYVIRNPHIQLTTFLCNSWPILSDIQLVTLVYVIRNTDIQLTTFLCNLWPIHSDYHGHNHSGCYAICNPVHPTVRPSACLNYLLSDVLRPELSKHPHTDETGTWLYDGPERLWTWWYDCLAVCRSQLPWSLTPYQIVIYLLCIVWWVHVLVVSKLWPPRHGPVPRSILFAGLEKGVKAKSLLVRKLRHQRSFLRLVDAPPNCRHPEWTPNGSASTPAAQFFRRTNNYGAMEVVIVDGQGLDQISQCL